MANIYWKSLDERERGGCSTARRRAEFVEQAAAEPSRRDVLRLFGFGAAAFGASCTRAPVQHAIPQVVQPDGIVPGGTAAYATTCAACAAGCGLLVTCRDGRPTKIEGMPEHPLSSGGVCAAGQAALLGLYDHRRFRGPALAGQAATWGEVDAALSARFEAIRQGGGAVGVVTSTVHSPTVRREIQAFLATFDDGVHVEYDPLSAAAVLDAHRVTHGVRALPHYHFNRADVIVGIDADFLGTWIAPVEFTSAYARRRAPGAPARPIWHVQIESRVSVTGGKADRRVALAPDEMAALVFDILAIIEADGDRPGASDAGSGQIEGLAGLARELAGRLLAAKGRALVITGIQDRDTQIRCNRINEALGSYGTTLDIDHPSFQRRGDDRTVEALLSDADAGRVAALLVWRANPFMELPDASPLRRVPLIVSFGERPDETTAAAHAICPDHHAFESWGDAEPVAGLVGLSQPLVQPLGSTRAFIETLSTWRGQPRNAHDIVRERWRAGAWSRAEDEGGFEGFWLRAVQAGFVTRTAEVAGEPATAHPSASRRPASSPAASDRAGAPVASGERLPAARPTVSTDTTTLVLYHKTGLPGGDHAWNPLLQELPDPVSKVVWDNYAAVAPAMAVRLGVRTGDVVRVTTETGALELPVLVQAGQHERTVAVALGYGGVVTERFKEVGHHWLRGRPTVGENGRVGVNAAPLLQLRDGLVVRDVLVRNVAPVGRRHELACTQDYHSPAVPAGLAPQGAPPRPIVQEVTEAELMETAAGRDAPPHRVADLWPDEHPAMGHRWGMVIDLDACTGCGGCVVACQVENNVPVVGKDEIHRSRDMQWLRIHRYFTEDAQGLHIANQPMFCQHCGHAPCETVCPTLATVHSAEGLNQQVYNRCVGTRYCANNCPYKVRRFNWFAYPPGEGTETLGLNPGVTVRTRGVMEKCTMCVHRIQEAKIDGRARGVALSDGDVQTACQQSCPARAISFGDLNDPASGVSRLAGDRRSYVLLEELNVKPAVTYLKIVRRRAPSTGGRGEHG